MENTNLVKKTRDGTVLLQPVEIMDSDHALIKGEENLQDSIDELKIREQSLEQIKIQQNDKSDSQAVQEVSMDVSYKGSPPNSLTYTLEKPHSNEPQTNASSLEK